MPLTVLQMAGSQHAGRGHSGDWLITISTYLQHGSPLYLLLYGARHRLLLLLLHGGAVQQRGNRRESEAPRRLHPRHPAGQGDRGHISIICSTGITVVGAAYLVLICLIPEFLLARPGLTFCLGGTSLLIVVNVTMDTVSQIQSHLIAHQYGDLIKKAKLKTARAGAEHRRMERGHAEHHPAGPAGRRQGHPGRAAPGERGMVQLSTGDMLRAAVANGTPGRPQGQSGDGSGRAGQRRDRQRADRRASRRARRTAARSSTASRAPGTRPKRSTCCSPSAAAPSTM